MARLFAFLSLSVIIILGFASRELNTSELMNHLYEEHASHSHDHHHDHEHTKDENDTSDEHSHTFELSSLNTAWNFERTEFESLKINFPTRELHAIATESHLTQKNFPLFIFRPPIS